MNLPAHLGILHWEVKYEFAFSPNHIPMAHVKHICCGTDKKTLKNYV